MAIAGTEDQVEPASAGMDKQEERGADSSSSARFLNSHIAIKFQCEIVRFRFRN